MSGLPAPGRGTNPLRLAPRDLRLALLRKIEFSVSPYEIFLRSLDERIFIISRYFEIVLRAIWIFISLKS
jgi:hypothetical protein